MGTPTPNEKGGLSVVGAVGTSLSRLLWLLWIGSGRTGWREVLSSGWFDIGLAFDKAVMAVVELPAVCDGCWCLIANSLTRLRIIVNFCIPVSQSDKDIVKLSTQVVNLSSPYCSTMASRCYNLSSSRFAKGSNLLCAVNLGEYLRCCLRL